MKTCLICHHGANLMLLCNHPNGPKACRIADPENLPNWKLKKFKEKNTQ